VPTLPTPTLDLDPEVAVLGACMHSPDATTQVAPILRGDDFNTPRHALIWDAIYTLHEANQPADPIAVAAQLGSNLNRAGGHTYLADLYTASFTTANVGYYARIVRDQATRRRLQVAAAKVQQLARTTDLPVDQMVALATAEVENTYRPDPDSAKTRIGDHLDEVLDDLQRPAMHGIPWPWEDVNDVLNPLTPGKVTVFAARPGMGKSVTLTDLAREWALRRGLTVVLFTLEMSAQEVIRRILSAEAKVPTTHLERKTLTGGDWDAIASVQGRLADAPLHIIDSQGATAADLRAAITTYSPDVVLLDYLQIAGMNPRLERRPALEEYMRSLKRLAMTQQVAIVTAAQINRQAEGRHDKKPQLSDLRETGAIEQDADTVVLLHRPDYYDPMDRPGEVDFIVAKQRGGQTRTVTLVHQLHFSRFVNIA
jgi:replicative DNA helicase